MIRHTLHLRACTRAQVASATRGGFIRPTSRKTPLTVERGTNRLLCPVERGGTLALIIEAAKGFELARLLVDGVAHPPAPTFSFRDVACHHSIIANFVPAAVKPFMTRLCAPLENLTVA